MVHLGFQHSRNCISQPRYFFRMNFNIRAECDLLFHNFHCALPEDMTDVEVTIQMVDGIHTYRRDRMTQAASYSPWSRLMKPFPSLRNKIAEYQEKKRRSFNPFTPVRETNFGKKRSRRSQKSRKYRKLDMGYFAPSTVAFTCPTTTTTINLSAPSNPPRILDVPKPPAPSKPSKTWAKPYLTSVPLSFPVHLDWPLEEDWDSAKQKVRERLNRIIKEQQPKTAEPRRKKREDEDGPLCNCVYLTQLTLNQIHPSLTL